MTEKLNIPASGGGLVRYYEEYKSKIQIRPEFIILFIVLIIIFEIVLRVI